MTFEAKKMKADTSKLFNSPRLICLAKIFAGMGRWVGLFSATLTMAISYSYMMQDGMRGWELFWRGLYNGFIWSVALLGFAMLIACVYCWFRAR